MTVQSFREHLDTNHNSMYCFSEKFYNLLSIPNILKFHVILCHFKNALCWVFRPLQTTRLGFSAWRNIFLGVWICFSHKIVSSNPSSQTHASHLFPRYQCLNSCVSHSSANCFCIDSLLNNFFHFCCLSQLLLHLLCIFTHCRDQD